MIHKQNIMLLALERTVWHFVKTLLIKLQRLPTRFESSTFVYFVSTLGQNMF